MMKKNHDIGQLKFAGDILVITIDGQENRFPLGTVSPLLAKASEEERHHFEISPAGYGIHWPLLDEDISIDGLLGISHAPERNGRVARQAVVSKTLQHAESNV